MLFVDESIQQKLGYICAGFVFCSSPLDEAIHTALREAGLTPGVDEYKSGSRMRAAEALHELRQAISRIVLEHCKIAVYIAPTEERSTLLTGVVESARKIVIANEIPTPLTLHVDVGIHGNVLSRNEDPIRLIVNCDSRQVPGIQLADYAAYHCSYLLRSKLEGMSKIVRVDMTPHPASDEDVELNWLIRTEIRRNFFVEHRDVEAIIGDDWFFKVAGYGAFYSDRLDHRLRATAQKVFDEMYFGCVW